MPINEDKKTGFGLVEIMVVLAIILLVIGVLIYGHHKSSDLLLKGSASTTLTIKRENPLNQPGVSDFTKVATNSSAITILNDIGSLKPAPQGTYNCPDDDGVEYSLYFSHPTLNISASAAGCQWIIMNNKSYLTSDIFWKDISNATKQPVDPDTNLQ